MQHKLELAEKFEYEYQRFKCNLRKSGEMIILKSLFDQIRSEQNIFGTSFIGWNLLMHKSNHHGQVKLVRIQKHMKYTIKYQLKILSGLGL